MTKHWTYLPCKVDDPLREPEKSSNFIGMERTRWAHNPKVVSSSLAGQNMSIMMKYVIFNFLLYVSCNNSTSSTGNINLDLQENGGQVLNSPCAEDSLKQNSFIWYPSVDPKGGIILKRGNKLSAVKNVDSAITLVAEKFKIKLKKIKTEGDTIFLEIVNTNYFTQQMGSTGSSEFMLSCIYTLTDHFGFNYVNFSFEEGDHGGQPGTRDRNHHHVESPTNICP